MSFISQSFELFRFILKEVKILPPVLLSKLQRYGVKGQLTELDK